MKKYMALYMAPASAIEQMMKATPEQMKAGMDDWMKWAKTNDKAIVQLGDPLGKTKSITSKGMSDTKNEITGYSIVQGDSAESVAKIFNGHPHFQMAGTSIELIEVVPIPAM